MDKSEYSWCGVKMVKIVKTGGGEVMEVVR